MGCCRWPHLQLHADCALRDEGSGEMARRVCGALLLGPSGWMCGTALLDGADEKAKAWTDAALRRVAWFHRNRAAWEEAAQDHGEDEEAAAASNPQRSKRQR